MQGKRDGHTSATLKEGKNDNRRITLQWTLEGKKKTQKVIEKDWWKGKGAAMDRRIGKWQHGHLQTGKHKRQCVLPYAPLGAKRIV